MFFSSSTTRMVFTVGPSLFLPGNHVVVRAGVTHGDRASRAHIRSITVHDIQIPTAGPVGGERDLVARWRPDSRRAAVWGAGCASSRGQEVQPAAVDVDRPNVPMVVIQRGKDNPIALWRPGGRAIQKARVRNCLGRHQLIANV